MSKHYRRHSTDAQQTASRKYVVRTFFGIVIIAAVLYMVGDRILTYFGTGNTIRRIGTTLILEEGGITNVSIEGEEMKRGEQGQKLYPGDRISTSGSSRASLRIFDDTIIRMEEMTDLSIIETYKGAEESRIGISMQNGNVWIQTPPRDVFSGSIMRIFSTNAMTLNIPDGTEALIQPRSLIVYSSDSLGITVKTKEEIPEVVIGEGQKYTLPPDGTNENDLYKYRYALDPLAVQIPFVEESRNKIFASDENNIQSGSGNTANILSTDENEITLTSPQDGITVDTATVNVEGKAGIGVSRVRVNGYNAPIENGSFSQELALPDEDEVDIVVIALSSDGETIAQLHRQIKRNREKPEPPTILKPAPGGSIYGTNEERIEILGTAPAGTVGIQVNDYRLQLFEPGDVTWTYLASSNIDNLKQGINTYKITAINKGGYHSEPVTLTIVLGSDTVGIIEGVEETQSLENQLTLPNNAPINPGTVFVTAPQPGTGFRTSERSFLLEGGTSQTTNSMWINGYRLRLYEPGKISWNYIADVEMNTLKRGTNTYEIIARDEQQNIIDRMTYTVEFTP